MRYILFVKEICPFCVKAVQLLEDKGVKYNLVTFDPGQEEILKEVKTAYDWKTVPMVFYRNNNLIKFIGGYTDLLEELKDG
jgi:glutaredoxin 3